jgi:hypothetical protein
MYPRKREGGIFETTLLKGRHNPYAGYGDVNKQQNDKAIINGRESQQPSVVYPLVDLLESSAMLLDIFFFAPNHPPPPPQIRK